jgi:endonuclease/exonuclease/phosphatase family metal-dependent hydrolase
MRLLTYNIHKGIGGRDRRYDFDRIVGVLEGENPDLILLQEVDCAVRRSRHHDQAVLLMERLAAHSGIFQLNVSLKSGGYGNLLLSRWPIVWHASIDLRMSVKKPRGAQLARVATPEGELLVANWHLGLAEVERRWQVQKVLAHDAISAQRDIPIIIAGDCNDWRNQLHKRCFEPAGFEQATSPPSRFRSFPAALSMGALDKAFFRGPLRVRGAHVVRNALTREASDHLPLVVDFHIEHGA